MGIKTVPQTPNNPDLAPCDFWLSPKLRGCCYETIEEMKEAVTKVIDTLTQEDFPGAFQKLLEWYNKWIAAGGDYFRWYKSFMCVLSIKVSIRKKSGNLFIDPRMWVCVCVCVCVAKVITHAAVKSVHEHVWRVKWDQGRETGSWGDRSHIFPIVNRVWCQYVLRAGAPVNYHFVWFRDWSECGMII